LEWNHQWDFLGAHHLRKDIQQRSRGECSNTDKGMDVWKALWSLKVHNFVKLFMWKACNNLLPSKLNLFRRGVVVDNLCPYYWREEESVIHALWSFPAVQDVWGCGPLIFQKSCSLGTNFLSTFAFFLMLCSKDELDLLAVLARRIWLRRNTLVFEGTFIHPNIVFKGAD
jgi:hypothetical protein